MLYTHLGRYMVSRPGAKVLGTHVLEYIFLNTHVMYSYSC